MTGFMSLRVKTIHVPPDMHTPLFPGLAEILTRSLDEESDGWRVGWTVFGVSSPTDHYPTDLEVRRWPRVARRWQAKHQVLDPKDQDNVYEKEQGPVDK